MHSLDRLVGEIDPAQDTDLPERGRLTSETLESAKDKDENCQTSQILPH